MGIGSGGVVRWMSHWHCFTCAAITQSISYLTPFAAIRTENRQILCGTQCAYKRSRFIIKFETKAGGKNGKRLG